MLIPCLSRSRIAFLILAALLLPATRAFAQQLPNLAPGVLRIVESAPEERDTATGPAPLLELAAQAPDWQPNYAAGSETLLAIANQVTLRRTVWQLEFAYKPMRMITIGNQRIWYLVYRVTNPGRHLRPSPNPDSFGHDKYSVELVSKSVRFTPTFHLQSYEFDQQYRDQILPAAVERIHKIEIRDPKIRLYDSVSISSQPILPSTSTEDNSLWGVATWVGVDPRIDFFSV
ncbi:MAG: hypothetical protein AAGF97_17940, partial [Planctomycetota bacterium]